MKAIELKIGNYINDNYCVQEIDIVSCGVTDMYNIDDVASYISLDLRNVKPIQLTDDWAVKLGYECMLEMACDFSYESKFDIEVTGKDLSEMKVHEAQNLFFALTNKELKLNKHE